MAKKLRDLPIGAKVKDVGSSYYGKDIVFLKVAQDHEGYPSNSTTLLSEKIICLKAVDAKEPNNSNSDRQKYGNNRYIYSNIRQWLNSSALSWYKAQHSADKPPTNSNADENPYDSEKGFMANLTPELRSAILPTSLKVTKNPVDGGGLESFTDSIFIPSCTEVGLSNDTSYDEGNKFDYFKSNLDRVAYPTKEATDNSTFINDNLSTSKGWDWWSRTPNSSSSFPHKTRVVSSYGSVYTSHAHNGTNGIRPALNVDSDVLVSDNPDSDGAYVITYNTPPTIDGEDTDLGTINSPFSIDYTVSDNDNDVVFVKEKINGKTIRDYTAELGKRMPLSIRDEIWLTLPNKLNIIEIIATDDKGATAVRKYTFTKAVDKSTVSLKTPLPAEEMIVRSVMTVTRKIPSGAKFKVEVCNNGFDTYPTWEDVTLQVESGRKFFFSNQTNTAGKWGYNFRIEIARGTADEPVYIRSVGGNFE